MSPLPLCNDGKAWEKERERERECSSSWGIWGRCAFLVVEKCIPVWYVLVNVDGSALSVFAGSLELDSTGKPVGGLL